MSYTWEKIASNKAKLSFVIPAEEFAEAMTKAYLKLRGRINVPGFRKGKAPRKMIESLYGENVFFEDALDEVFPELYNKALDESGIQAVDQPSVSVDEYEKGQDVKISCEVFTRPEVVLGQYKGLSVEIDRQTVTDADIDARIERDRAKQSRTVEVLDRPVEDGDTVKLDYAGTVDGVAFEGGTAEDQTLTIGSHTFIPGFEEQMIGMCVAEERDLNVTFPEEYGHKELAGKAAVFHVKVNSISRTEMPELDDDFAADVSDFTTFAEYRESVAEELKSLAEKNNEVSAENAVVAKAAENAQMEIPEAMVGRETERLMRSMEASMRAQNIDPSFYYQMVNQTREQVAESRRADAIEQLRIQLTLEAVIKAEGIEATEEEIDEVLKEEAAQMNEDADKLRETLTDSQREYLKERANINRAVKLMMEEAVVSDAPAAAEEPAKAEETAEAEDGSAE